MIELLLSSLRTPERALNRFLERNDDPLRGLALLVVEQIPDRQDAPLSEEGSSSAPQTGRLRVLSYRERGLSLSRNRALDNASGDICLLSDDDVRYRPDLADILSRAFEENPEADIITFQATDPDGRPLKNYPRRATRLNILSASRVSSIEIAFRHSSVLKSDLRFDTLFGLGAKYPIGEEYVFVTDALKRGLTVIHLPIPILTHPLESSGRKHDAKTTFARGAMLARVFGWAALPLDLVFALKKLPLYRKDRPFMSYLSSLWSGSWDYLKKRTSF
ncbi:MAG TPA: glycosyltransferase family 2 protein [bacterium]|nr:glycosyltransferase family 2 protein [bacterium]